MKDRLDYLGNGLAVIFTVAQSDEVFKIISLVLTCLSVALTIAYRIWEWYKKAKKDGKIESEEIKNLADIMKEEKEKIDNMKKENEK